MTLLDFSQVKFLDNKIQRLALSTYYSKQISEGISCNNLKDRIIFCIVKGKIYTWFAHLDWSFAHPHSDKLLKPMIPGKNGQGMRI